MMITKTNKSLSKTISLCQVCSGYGYTTQQYITNYHDREYRYEKLVCYFCEGSGRMQVTTEITKEPYKPEGKTEG